MYYEIKFKMQNAMLSMLQMGEAKAVSSGFFDTQDCIFAYTSFLGDSDTKSQRLS